MTVEEIIKDHLKRHGYDGLLSRQRDCGCRTENLKFCENYPADCQSAYRILCSGCDEGYIDPYCMSLTKYDKCWKEKAND